MIKQFLILLFGFCAAMLGLGAVKIAQIKEASSQTPQMPVTAVTSVEARSEMWHPHISAIGTLSPVQGVALSADADGTLQKIEVENGAAVKAGDLLMQLDVTVEAAQLKAAEAQLALAELEAKRAKELLEKQTISQSELDRATAQLDQGKANVAALQAMIDKKSIRAPFDGRVGIRLVNLGQYISRGQPLIPLQKLNPLYVDFSVPQRQLPQISVGQPVQVVVDAFPGKVFTGRIAAVNPEVSASTRNGTVQAVIENPEEQLRAGMFARVEVELPQNEPTVVLPATAVSYAAYGNSVYIIEKMKDPQGNEYLGVRQEFVKLGNRRGDQIAVLDKVKPGDQVVSSGVFKLRKGMPVQVNNVVEPSNNHEPKPANT